MLVVGGVVGCVGTSGHKGADFGLSVQILQEMSNVCVVGALRILACGTQLVEDGHSCWGWLYNV